MDKNFTFDDFIFKGDELKGMTRAGKDKVKAQGIKEIIIPTESPDGVPVRVIGEQCFYRRKFESIVIPETVEVIKYDAFGVNALTEVIIPDSVKEIYGFAFYRNKITDIKLPKNLVYIGPSAFALNQIGEINLPYTVEVIETSAFYKNNLTSIKIPKNIKKIDMFAFNKNGIMEVEVPNSIETLHENAFDFTTNVKRI